MIGLFSTRAFGAYVSLLAILATDNTYVPLNEQWPRSRLLEIWRRTGLSALLLDERSMELTARFGLVSPDLVADRAATPYGVETTVLRTRRATPAAAFWDPAKARGLSSDYAYLIFTSGSSGHPKGIPVTHKNVTTCIEGVSELIPLDEQDRVAQMSDLSFDVSVAEMFMCWRSGACLVVPSHVDSISPGRFISGNRVTIWSSVPSRIRALRDLGTLNAGAFPRVRTSMFCGETLPSRLAEAWSTAAPNSDVVNVYGPTEASIFATACRWNNSMNEMNTVPIGAGLPAMLCDIAPIDDGNGAGELLLAGPQVVSGYWNDPAGTEAAFMRRADGRIWYKTGDLVDLDPSHGLRFKGRMNSQVKCRGYRIDTEEVAQAVAWAACAEQVVVVPAFDRDGLCDALVAFCDSLRSGEAATRARCAERLPAYMVPRRLVRIDTFPLTPNGKVNRAQLILDAREIVDSVG
jgi:amino acid adenylation domain-containing protein